jgi:hypothetical protein
VIGQQSQRQALRIQRRVVLALPAVSGQRLTKVAGPVVQSHRHKGQAEIGRRFQMVAGKYAKAAGVVRQHLGDAEFHREIRDAVGHFGVLGGAFLVPERPGKVIVELADQLVQPADERLVDSQFVQPVRGDLTEERHRIAPDLLPQFGVDGREQVLRRFVPRPAQVDRQRLQRDQPLGKVRADGEPTKGFHATQPY